MTKPEISDLCSLHFTYENFFHCGETWRNHRPTNAPIQFESWESFAQLAKNVLDPFVDALGMPALTFGFCGPGLAREIRKKALPGIAPNLDQHAACEIDRRGELICPRKGAAVDLVGKIDSLKAAKWLIANTPFDRLYFYGDNRPLHISYGPQNKRQIVLLHSRGGHRRPQVISKLDFMDL